MRPTASILAAHTFTILSNFNFLKARIDQKSSLLFGHSSYYLIYFCVSCRIGPISILLFIIGYFLLKLTFLTEIMNRVILCRSQVLLSYSAFINMV